MTDTTHATAIADAQALVPALVYPGRPFRRHESLLFFGRQEHVDELLGRLADTTFLAVVGLSGSGKSSLVFAGLVPALERGHLNGAGAAWKIAEMRPGSDPISGLLHCLNRALGTSPERAAQLRSGPLGLIEASKTGRAASENLLLVVDQFEEIFRFQRDHKEKAHEAAEFVRLLIAATQEYGGRVYVVLTMRSDYLGECSRFPGLPEILNGCQYLTPRLTGQQATEAIRGPAALAGVSIEMELLAHLVDETTERRDQLPILQHLLMQMWKVPGRGATLTRKEFLAVGGLNALNLHVQQVYDESPDRDLARRVFQCLTDSSEGDRENRRPRRLDELAAETGASESDVAAIVEHFRAEGRGFLTSPDEQLTSDSVIDIQHESIIREWTSLKQWAQREAESGKWYQRVEDRARVGRGRVYLVDDELTAALKACSSGNWNDAWSRRYAGNDGLKFDEVVGLLEASRQQDIKTKRTARRRWWALVAATVMFAGLSVASIALLRIATQQTKIAEDALKRAEAANVAAAIAEGKAQDLQKENERLRNPKIEGNAASSKPLPIAKLAASGTLPPGYPPCDPFDVSSTSRSDGAVTGLSLHIAANRVDPTAYAWSTNLPSTLADARAMQQIATSLGYRATIATDDRARSDCLGTALTAAASTLRPGDSFLLTISGNGTQINTSGDNPDQPSRKLEAWVLFDGLVTADDLYNAFSKFASGVTLIVVEDISHPAAFRRPLASADLAATLIVLAGAAEDQMAMDGRKNGAFTEALLSVWNNGKFNGGYSDLVSAVRQKSSVSQQPQLYAYGPKETISALKPFRLSH